jgi:addiction module RelB/DinJ family antitoxin
MDTTLTVRLDTQLKEEAERTLDSLGLSMSSAIRVFLTHVVAQQALPFPVQAAPVASPQREDAIEYPLHVEVEVLLAQMAAITARLFELEQGEVDAAKRSELAQVRKAMQAMRFQFDPYSKSEVLAMVQRIGQYASVLQIGRPN